MQDNHTRLKLTTNLGYLIGELGNEMITIRVQNKDLKEQVVGLNMEIGKLRKEILELEIKLQGKHGKSNNQEMA